MADTIEARQHDTLDGLLWRERRLGTAAQPAVLEANPGLAALGAILPLGTKVTVPPAAVNVPVERELVQLWS